MKDILRLYSIVYKVFIIYTWSRYWTVHIASWNGVSRDFNKPMCSARPRRVKKDIQAFMFYESCVKSDALSLNHLKVMDSRSKLSCEPVCGGTNHRQGFSLLDSLPPLISASHCPVTFVSQYLFLYLNLSQSCDGVNLKTALKLLRLIADDSNPMAQYASHVRN